MSWDIRLCAATPDSRMQGKYKKLQIRTDIRNKGMPREMDTEKDFGNHHSSHRPVREGSTSQKECESAVQYTGQYTGIGESTNKGKAHEVSG